MANSGRIYGSEAITGQKVAGFTVQMVYLGQKWPGLPCGDHIMPKVAALLFIGNIIWAESYRNYRLENMSVSEVDEFTV